MYTNQYCMEHYNFKYEYAKIYILELNSVRTALTFSARRAVCK